MCNLLLHLFRIASTVAGAFAFAVGFEDGSFAFAFGFEIASATIALYMPEQCNLHKRIYELHVSQFLLTNNFLP